MPVLIKLTPNTDNIVKLANAACEAGADTLTAVNTLRGMAIDIAKRRPLLGNRLGGLSGPAVKPVALYMVFEVAGAVDVPIVGCGGITTASDAIEFIMAGAGAVQVGTANLLSPRSTLDILEGIEAFAKKKRVSSLSDLIGVARR